MCHIGLESSDGGRGSWKEEVWEPMWRWREDTEDILGMKVREAPTLLTTKRESFGQAVSSATFHKEPP